MLQCKESAMGVRRRPYNNNFKNISKKEYVSLNFFLVESLLSTFDPLILVVSLGRSNFLRFAFTSLAWISIMFSHDFHLFFFILGELFWLDCHITHFSAILVLLFTASSVDGSLFVVHRSYLKAVFSCFLEKTRQKVSKIFFLILHKIFFKRTFASEFLDLKNFKIKASTVV